MASDTLKQIADNLGVSTINGSYLNGIADYYGVDLATSTDLMRDILTEVGGNPATSTDYLQDIVLELGGTVTINENWMEAWEAITAVAPAPVNSTLPVISGTTTLGSVLTTTNGTWTNSPTSYTYQWKRGATNIGTNTNTYTLVTADSLASITCVVTAINAGGSTPATSNTITADNYAPVNTVAPVISGSTPVGSTLTTTNGTWTNSPTFAYQWYRGATLITSATSTTYITQVADAGLAVTCRVTGTNPVGSAIGISNSITPTADVAPYVITAPTLSTYSICSNPGNSVTIQSMVLGGTPAPTITYNWVQVNPIDPGLPPIEIGQYTNTLYLGYELIETYLYCIITATNTAGELVINTPEVYAYDCT